VGLLLFADVFLIRSCLLSVQEMRDIAARRAELESTNEIIESEVRQRTAELLRAREVAESASRAKTVFLENVTHELRTPMNGIMGMTELALDTQLTDEQHDYLTNVRSSSERLLLLLNDVLDFTAMEAGKVELAPAEFRLRERIGHVLSEMRGQASRKGLRLNGEVAADVPDLLIADAQRICQLLGKLVDNAVKFTREGEVCLRVQLAGGRQDPLELHFSVSDTGIGIAPEKLETIFRPFEQADTSSTRQFGGAGLGLAVAAQLVRLMAGRLWVDSTVGRGSTFHFTVRCGCVSAPAAAETPPERAAAQGGAAALGERKLQILLAEDNLVNQAYALRTLAKQGHTVVVANNGEEAIRVWEREPIDLVLMDLQMPGVDGLQATAAIRERERQQGRHTPIIAITAHADRERCQAAGMDGFVSKPVQADQLFAEIGRVTGLFPAAASRDEKEAETAATISLDRSGLMERVHHDTEFLAELVGLFAEDGRALLGELQTAISGEDGAALARAAHTFKGMAGSLCAHAAMQIALELETLGKQADFGRAAEQLGELEQEVARVSDALHEMLEAS
jgi:signal transduction histidine kinase/CheY-like chemotaxis protein